MWFISGMVMMYVGYPKLTPAERLRHLPRPAQARSSGTAQATHRGGRPVDQTDPGKRPPSMNTHITTSWQ
jgi:hypothetical protein